MKRRLLLGWVVCAMLHSICLAAESPESARPNILWITSEDHGPNLGCYGDEFATTPNIDGLAKNSLRYQHVWSCAPVCAPARTTLITGMYANSLGAEHMRSMVPLPQGVQLFPRILRDAGYYCSNNSKEDYNVATPEKIWDDSSNKAHWKNRPAGAPFFAVFNSNQSHEGQIRKPVEVEHDPARVRIPTYHPDTPEVRRDWARYYNIVSAADAEAGARLRELAEAGLTDSTIVFYFADHGAGLPRHKRSARDSGLRVPLVIHIPERFAHLRPDDYSPGGTSDRLVSFVDFAPTVLSLAGVRPPAWMQGEAFLGEFAGEPRQYLFGFRGRMDERYDLVRAATDGRFVYIRNFLPHRIAGQHVSYMFETETTKIWRQMHDQGELNPAQDAFWHPKPPEELYDLNTDPDEVLNLADSPAESERLARFRIATREWILNIRDVGLLPEGEMHSRSKGSSPYEMAREDERFPLKRILEVAALSSNPNDSESELAKALRETDSAVRYWGAVGMLIRGQKIVSANRAALLLALDDSSTDVRIAAAEALGRYSDQPEDAQRSLNVLRALADWSRSDVFAAIAALNALDQFGEPGDAVRAELRMSSKRGRAPHGRYSAYVPRLLDGGGP